MTKNLIVEIHPDWKCWIAYQGNDPWESGVIGEGTTRENAVADYWSGVHGYDNTARLMEPEWPEFRWFLYDGKNAVYFDSYEEAAQYGEENEYLI